MNAIIGQLASQFGLGESQTESAVGSIFKLLQKEAPANDFQQLVTALPAIQGWIAKAGSSAAGESSGGLLGNVGGMLGGLIGGGGVAAALAELSKAGLNPDLLGRFVPALIEQLKTNVDPALISKVIESIPALPQLLAKAGK